MSTQITLKAVLMTATLCALAGLANSASAAECRQTDGNCQAQANAGADRRVSFRCTINISIQPDRGNCKVVEVATGRFLENFDFTGDTGTRVISTPTTGAYQCRVEAVGPDRGTAFCAIN